MSLNRGRRLLLATLLVPLVLASLIVAAQPASAAAAPTVTVVAPGGGRAFGSERIAVYGSGFQSGVTVMFGDIAGLFVRVASPHKLIVISPTHSAGVVDVRVISPNGTSRITARDRFTFVNQPAVRTFAPRSGRITGGERITVYGSNFRNVKAVLFDNVKGTDVRVLSSTKLLVTTPTHATGRDGMVLARVNVITTYATTNPFWSGWFEYVAPPTISGVGFPNGFGAGGERVQISGYNLVKVRSVTFDGVPATSVVADPAGILLEVVAPAHAVIVDVRVTTAYGASNVPAGGPYASFSSPAISAISPGTAAAVGGDRVTIKGSGFMSVKSVTFGGVPSPQLSVINDATLIAVAPPHVAGLVDVAVTRTFNSTSVPFRYR